MELFGSRRTFTSESFECLLHKLVASRKRSQVVAACMRETMAEASVTIVLRDGEETVTCSRALLMKHSEYFRAMLEGGHFREASDALDGKAITVTEEWLRAETFKNLLVLLALSEFPESSCRMKDYICLLSNSHAKRSVEDPQSPYALLKMCIYFQMHRHVDLFLDAIYNNIISWPLDVVPFLCQLKPGILQCPKFPYDTMIDSVLTNIQNGKLEDALASISFPNEFLVRLLQKQTKILRDSRHGGMFGGPPPPMGPSSRGSFQGGRSYSGGGAGLFSNAVLGPG
uniref:BTB domain-containing protein n=1 Tax=Chromera velia CCMP2878 TaxID=1169474 RepID=A0A0G4FX81_9ALVE|eukprot:Cvel_19225.t1-p1 / transcript=Cvel_19225.t1 / gene=Cvel_19225 / organism=Chromera_velia_CCMP2878 / gene_product=hypothetical protein / transcript_product=hypothetical protein / location=Cvel_scaffold1643:1952-3249(-) / protein_length=284 / sequence_SO=supercontig / SO=protein_coding / is_pseudo=false